MARLSEAQMRVLREIAGRPTTTAWVWGTATCEALRKRGLVSRANGEDKPFKGGWRDNGYVYITEAGRRALSPEPSQ